jgi:hypothetical protein
MEITNCLQFAYLAFTFCRYIIIKSVSAGHIYGKGGVNDEKKHRLDQHYCRIGYVQLIRLREKIPRISRLSQLTREPRQPGKFNPGQNSSGEVKLGDNPEGVKSEETQPGSTNSYVKDNQYGNQQSRIRKTVALR